MPKAMLPGRLYPIVLEGDSEVYGDDKPPTFFAIIPTMTEAEEAAQLYDDFSDSARYPKLRDLHEHGCVTLAKLIKGWSHMTDREGNTLEYKGADSLRQVLVLGEVMELIGKILRLTSLTPEQKKTLEPLP